MGKVYIIRAKGTDSFKIGRTAGDPRKRMASLQVGCPHELEIFYVIETKDEAWLEQAMHKKLEEFRGVGEWFDINSNKMMEIACSFSLISQTNEDGNGKMPWEFANPRITKGINLRLNEVQWAKLDYIRENSMFSIQKFIMNNLEPAIELAIKKLMSGESL